MKALTKVLSPNVSLGDLYSRFSSAIVPHWNKYSDDELLRLRIQDLDLHFADTGFQALANQLLLELCTAGFQFLAPKFYIGDEWFTPEGSGYIAFPFYLAHKRLVALEKNILGDVEGEKVGQAMLILRHEAGHCFEHAYKVSALPKWKKLFGDRTKPYEPDEYSYDPFSRSYVHNLPDCYAQAHPDEDFAETFAVWLNPEVDWRKKYRDWPRALSKLEYIDELVTMYRDKKPRYTCHRPMSAASSLKTTLAAHYGRRLTGHLHRI